jgi:hypothetical protein
VIHAIWYAAQKNTATLQFSSHAADPVPAPQNIGVQIFDTAIRYLNRSLQCPEFDPASDGFNHAELGVDIAAAGPIPNQGFQHEDRVVIFRRFALATARPNLDNARQLEAEIMLLGLRHAPSYGIEI